MFAQVLPVVALASFAAARPIASTVLAAVEASVTLPNTTQTNNATYYYQNGNAGACGLYSEDSDLVVGLPLEFYNNTGAVSTYCGSYVVVTNVLNNATVISRVADASAASEELSLSVATYKALDGESTDLNTVTWRFANETEKAEAVAALISGSSTYSADAVAAASSSSAAPAAAVETTSSAEKAATTSAAAAKATTTTAEKKTTTTEAYVAPKTTTTTKAYVAPTTTTTTKAYVAPTTQVVAAAATTTKKSTSSSSSGSYSGQATFYYQGGNAGSCGNVNSDSSYIVAVNSAQVNGGSHCGSKVYITNTANGKSVTATVADECPSCSYGSLDLSVGAFDAIGSQDSGVLPITWSFA